MLRSILRSGRAVQCYRSNLFIRRSESKTAVSYAGSNPFESISYAHFRLAVNTIVRDIADDELCTKQAGKQYIEATSWLNYLSTFRRSLVTSPILCLGSKVEFDRLCRDLSQIVPSADSGSDEIDTRIESFLHCKESLFRTILNKAVVELGDVIHAYQSMNLLTDLKKPHEWYPLARIMKRKIIFHGGPTNSGKTYHALRRLKEADVSRGGGLYCGPLRLLALEVYEQLNRQGISTSLITGQEKREILGSTHVSSTLEMVSTTKEYDVAVIDEIQMIADKERGHAWTKALLGLRARELHLCGGLEAEQLVRSLVASSGDEFVLQRYDRLSHLHIEEQSLRGDYTQVQPGDCIVAFSKSDIFSIRRQIEENTSFKCAVIYGQLPPETRSTQARLFNETGSGYDVLVASDAIGMGLNLNIRRVIFHTTVKREKSSVRWLEPSSVKQIAGRAGRLSSQYKAGLVTAWQEVDLAYVKAVMEWDLPPLTSAGIFPSIDLIEVFGDSLMKMNEGVVHSAGPLGDATDAESVYEEYDSTSPLSSAADPTTTTTTPAAGGGPLHISPDNIRLSVIISNFVRLSQIDSRFFMCDHLQIVTISNWLHAIPLSIADRFIFASCPVNLGDPLSMTLLYQFAAKYAMRRPVAVNIRLSLSPPRTLEEFAGLCMRHNVLDLYLWLSSRFPKYFIERELCIQQKAFAVRLIEDTLMTAKFNRKYMHGGDYLKLRTFPGKDLPPLQYGAQIRNRFQELIDLVRMEDRIIVKDDDDDSQLPPVMKHSSRNVYRNVGGGVQRSAVVGGGRDTTNDMMKSVEAEAVDNADNIDRPFNRGSYSRSSSSDNKSRPNNGDSNSRPTNRGVYNRPDNGDKYSRPTDGDSNRRPTNRGIYNRPDNGDNNSSPTNGITNTGRGANSRTNSSRPTNGDTNSRPTNRGTYSRSSSSDNKSRPNNGDSNSRPTNRGIYNRPDSNRPSNGENSSRLNSGDNNYNNRGSCNRSNNGDNKSRPTHGDTNSGATYNNTVLDTQRSDSSEATTQS